MSKKNLKKQRTISTKIVLDGAGRYLKEAVIVNESLKKIETTLMSINEQLDKMKNHLAQLNPDSN